MQFSCSLVLRQHLIHLHQRGNALALGVELAPEAVCFHDGFIVRLARLAEVSRHGSLVVEVGEGAVQVRGSCVKNCWRCALDVIQILFLENSDKNQNLLLLIYQARISFDARLEEKSDRFLYAHRHCKNCCL